jgi:SAM-dependent methyltransferase
LEANRLMAEIKQDVRQFYDQIGWSLVGEDLYQNARYEDLRPVSQEYIHRCHLRVGRRLAPAGRYLLDAGSGPIQYLEYFEYSRNYQYRVCADISITALIEARKRLANHPELQIANRDLQTTNYEHGMFVVADVANLPFKSAVFDGIVSLHTIHHLPEDEHLQAYEGLYRVLAPGKSAVVVNGWPSSKIMAFFDPLVRLNYRLRRLAKRLRGRTQPAYVQKHATEANSEARPQKGTFTSRHDIAWIKNEVGSLMPVEIQVWRSASVRFLRAVIYPWLAGKYWLRLLFWLEERYPHYFGENGQYPLIVIKKKSGDALTGKEIS